MKDELRRVFDASTEAPHPSLRAALRARLEAGPAQQPHRALRLVVGTALVAGLVGLAFIGGVALLPRGGGNPSAPAGVASPTPSAEPTATPAATVESPVPSPSDSATAPTTACATSSGGVPSGANVTDVRVGSAAGYDRFVIQFDGPVPTYSITPQDSSVFMQDATGQMLQLQGTTGVRIVVRGASGWDVNAHQTFNGSQDLKPGFPALKEARQVGDFERVFSWGLGIAQPSCLKVTVLTGPDRLVVDVLKP
jgi:hypothetical protein